MSTLAATSTLFGTKQKNSISLVKELRAAGGDSEVKLWRIAVIGNQSSGKSSVIEGLSGVAVPRDVGTCTRCPIETRISSSTSPWTCQLSIRWEYAEDGTRLDDIQERPYGLPITDPLQIEPVLRSAQTAVLTEPVPGCDLSLRKLAKDSTELRKPRLFSRNADTNDLGLVSNANPEVVDFVENMVVSHIKGNTLILVVIPMTDDIENQRAFRLARQVDPSGLRTIGVMTKPDMLSHGSIAAQNIWRDILENRKHQLHLGYYCVRRPDDEDRNNEITPEQARSKESTFFSSSRPWSTSSHQERLGITNLVKALSAVLSRTIDEGLSSLRSDVVERLGNCMSQLTALPKAITDEPLVYILQLVTEFCMDVNSFVEGVSDTSMLQQNRTAFKAFDLAIKGTSPQFLPCHKQQENQQVWIDWLKQCDDDEGIVRDGNDRMWFLDELRDHVERSLTRELPGDVPFRAKVDLMTQFQSSWKESTTKCFLRVRGAMRAAMIHSLKRIMGRFDLLLGQMRPLVDDHLDILYHRCFEHLSAVLEAQQTPYTQNSECFLSYRTKWLAKFKEAKALNEGKQSHPAPSSQPAEVTLSSRTVPTPQQPGITMLTPQGGSHPTGKSLTTKSSRAPETLPRESYLLSASSSDQTITKSNTFQTVDQELHHFSFSPHLQTDGKSSIEYQDISVMPVYSHLSAMELRVAFYRTSNRYKPPVLNKLARNITLAPNNLASRSDTDNVDKLNQALALLTELGYSGMRKEDLGKLHPADEYEPEMEMMAEVHAYFQVARMRVIDNIPQLIDLLFIKGIAKSLQAHLVKKLDLGSARSRERCQAWLAEDPNMKHARSYLERRKLILETLLHKLDSY